MGVNHGVHLGELGPWRVTSDDEDAPSVMGHLPQ